MAKCEAGLDEVKATLLDKAGLNSSGVEFHVGWFQDTVPISTTKLKSIALLRLAGDWYASTQVCLEHLYPRLSPGGVLVLDDYFRWEGCRKATDEYRTHHKITTPSTRIDADRGYWIKP